MARVLPRMSIFVFLLIFSAFPALSQDTPPADPFAFGLGLGIGVQTFNEAEGPVAYQSLSFTPDLSFGPFGIGLALTLNYRFNESSEFTVREADWIPTDLGSFLSIYLAKIAYVRWGVKGEPLFIKAGSFTDATLGNGFIMANYDNTLFLPETRIFGLGVDVDGALFAFPFVGIETIIGNLAAFDVLGGRLYVRPLAGTGIPILENLEVGGTLVADTSPDLYIETAAEAAPILVFGGDIRQPILTDPVFSLAAFADVASIQGDSLGGALGFGGRIIGIFTYGAQFRVLGPDFIPTYFNATYDLFRSAQYDAVKLGGGTETTIGWFATLGTALMEDKIIFNVGLDGPFSAPYPDAVPADPEYVLNYPHLRGIFTVAEGIIPGISLDFSYDKKGIASCEDLISPENAAIQTRINYRTGPAVISFIFMIRYAPGESPDWETTSGLQSSIQLF
jgi:hypothetical protein